MTRIPVFAVTAMVLLGACAQIPDSGPVERVVAPAARTHSTVRYEPARPRRGATPLRISEGYLDAMLAYPEATGIVESYLTAQAARDWESGAGVTVYSSAIPGLRSVSGSRAQVAVRLRQVMTINESGRATMGSKVTTRILQLAREGGQWRVDNPIPGYLVSESFARDYIHAYPLWYFDESGQRLVPELVHAVVSEQLPLTLLNRLADGPVGSTRRTYLPSADNLRVRLSGDTVEIDLHGQSNGSADKIAAQLLSTLRGVPGVDRVRMNGVLDGKAHALDDTVVGFGPGPQPGRPYALRGNRVIAVSSRPQPLAGAWGKSAHGAVDVVVGAESVAAVRRGRSSVVVGSRRGGRLATYPGTDFVHPQWDDSDRLWLVDNPASARVRVVVGAGMVDVDSGGLGAVESFAVSPDGSRYAAVVTAGRDAQVVTGDIVHDADGFPRRLGAPTLVSRGLAGEREVGWASQTRVEFVADTTSAAQLYVVGVDGADRTHSSRSEMLPGGVVDWAGAPNEGADRWALDRRGRVWVLSSGHAWRRVTGAAAGALRALSSGY